MHIKTLAIITHDAPWIFSASRRSAPQTVICAEGHPDTVNCFLDMGAPTLCAVEEKAVPDTDASAFAFLAADCR